MKKLVLGLLFGLGLTVAYAQNPPTANINTSLQGSQFGNGPVGVDTSSNLYAPSHVNFFGNKQSGTTSPQTCGNATITSASTDNVFQFTSGIVTSCQLTFGNSFVNVPVCSLTIPGSTVIPTYTATTTGVNVSAGLASLATKVTGICLGND